MTVDDEETESIEVDLFPMVKDMELLELEASTVPEMDPFFFRDKNDGGKKFEPELDDEQEGNEEGNEVGYEEDKVECVDEIEHFLFDGLRTGTETGAGVGIGGDFGELPPDEHGEEEEERFLLASRDLKLTKCRIKESKADVIPKQDSAADTWQKIWSVIEKSTLVGEECPVCLFVNR